MRRGRHPDRRRPFDRHARADLRPGRARPGASGQGEAQQLGEGGRRPDPRQAARHRHPFGGAEEGQAVRRGLRADGRLDHASSTRRARRSPRCRTCTRSPTSPASAWPATCSRSAAARSSPPKLRFDDLPVIAEALDWVKQGVATGASDRNWKGYGARSRAVRGERVEAQAADAIRRPAADCWSHALRTLCSAVLRGVRQARLRTRRR